MAWTVQDYELNAKWVCLDAVYFFLWWSTDFVVFSGILRIRIVISNFILSPDGRCWIPLLCTWLDRLWFHWQATARIWVWLYWFVISCRIWYLNAVGDSIRNDLSNFNIFSVTEKEFHEEFDKLLVALDVKSPFFLVVQVRANWDELITYQ